MAEYVFEPNKHFETSVANLRDRGGLMIVAKKGPFNDYQELEDAILPYHVHIVKNVEVQGLVSVVTRLPVNYELDNGELEIGHVQAYLSKSEWDRVYNLQD